MFEEGRYGVGAVPWCLISLCGRFLCWSPKQKVFLGLPTKGGESVFLWTADGAAGGWAVATILSFKLRSSVVSSCSLACVRFFGVSFYLSCTVLFHGVVVVCLFISFFHLLHSVQRQPAAKTLQV